MNEIRPPCSALNLPQAILMPYSDLLVLEGGSEIREARFSAVESPKTAQKT